MLASIPLLIYTVKKDYRFSPPQPGCHQPNSPWLGIIKLIPARESLVSDIPAGDGKIGNLFFGVEIIAISLSLHGLSSFSMASIEVQLAGEGGRREFQRQQKNECFFIILIALCVVCVYV
jgi:hypothetical protein